MSKKEKNSKVPRGKAGFKQDKVNKKQVKSRKNTQDKKQKVINEPEQVENESLAGSFVCDECYDAFDIKDRHIYGDKSFCSECFEELEVEDKTLENKAKDVFNENDYDVISQIKSSLEAAGFTSSADITYTLWRKTANGYTGFVRSYKNEIPDLEQIGKDFGGGSFQLRASTGKGYVTGKTFYLDTIAFPEKKPVIVSDTGVNTQERNNITYTDVLLKEVLEKQTAMFEQLFKKDDKSKTTELTEIINLVKTLTPEQPRQSIDTGKIINEMTNMFQSGMQFAKDSMEGRSEDTIQSVLVGLLRENANKVPVLIDALTGRENEKNALKDRPVLPEKVDVKSQQSVIDIKRENQVIDDFFLNVIDAFESKTYVHPYFFAEKIRNQKRYKILLSWIEKFNADVLMNYLSGTGLKLKLSDVNFFEYVKTIIDITKKYDTIELDSEGNIIDKKEVSIVIPEQGQRVESGANTETGAEGNKQ